MTNTIAILQTQIRNSRNLLSLFQDEREHYLQKKSISMKEIIEILQKKMQLVSTLEEQKQLVKNSAKDIDITESNDPDNVKEELVRELSDVLEQLLVIEHENEMLLKKVIDQASNTSTAMPPPPKPRRLPTVSRFSPELLLRNETSGKRRKEMEKGMGNKRHAVKESNGQKSRFITYA